jgi:hypothetical protein
MASRKKKTTRAKMPPKPKAKRPILESNFAKDFEKELLRGNDGKYKWPKVAGGPPVSESSSYQDIADTIMVLGLASGGLVPPKNGSVFRDLVIDFVNNPAHSWPQGAELPAPYRKPTMLRPVRISIISDIVHRMLLAVNKGGQGSGGEPPPHHL